MLQIYGIKNCDTIKKTLKWFDAHQTDVHFIDYKKQPPDQALVEQFVAALGWEALINKRGTTWRKLDDSVKNSIDTASAIALMQAQPAIIKRPVIRKDGQFWVGYDETIFKTLI